MIRVRSKLISLLYGRQRVLSTYRFRVVALCITLFAFLQRLLRRFSSVSPAFQLSLPPPETPKKYLYVQVSHGLGNRLRAYASAAALAKKCGRKLGLVWIPDIHLNATFHELFDNAVHVLSESFLDSAYSSPDFVVYDYITHPVDWRKRQPVLDKKYANKHIYVYTAYSVVGTTKTQLSDFSRELQLLKPSMGVDFHIRRFEKTLRSQLGISLHDLVGVHIRMQSDLSKDIPGIERVNPSDPAALTNRMLATAQVRKSCHFSYFIDFIRQEVVRDKSQLFYIASDSMMAIKSLRSAINANNIITMNETMQSMCFSEHGRARGCMEFALAELYVLFRSKELVLSLESSYSEVAQKYSPHKRVRIGCAVNTLFA